MPDQRARDLRKHQTEAEKLLWSRMRNRQLGGFKFRRQHPVPPYILDFYNEEYKIAIELDGDTHGHEKQIKKDKERTTFLAKQGISVIRFWNNEVFQNLEGVLETILNHIEYPSPTSLTPLRGEAPLPSPPREREGPGEVRRTKTGG